MQGGAIATWMQSGQANPDIYAQRIDATGAPVWTLDGRPASLAISAQRNPWIASDGAGGAVLAWEDARSVTAARIYAQHVNANGSLPVTLQRFSVE